MRGPFPIMSTPYHEDGSVDYEALAREALWVDDSGCPGVIWCQSNDAIDLLTTEEKFKGFEACAAAVEGRDIVMTFGANGTNTAELIEIALEIERVAARHPRAKIAMISRPPDDVRSQDDIEKAWDALGRVSKRPVIFQTYGTKMTPTPSVELIVRLAEKHPHAFGYVKEEAAGWEANVRMRKESAAKPVMKTVFAGWGGWQWLLQLRDCGSEGLVTERCAYAPVLAELWRRFESGERGSRLTEAFAMYRVLVDQHNFPAGLRGYSLYLLKKAGVFRNMVSRQYEKATVTKGGSFGSGRKWKLEKVRLNDLQRRELDRLWDDMLEFSGMTARKKSVSGAACPAGMKKGSWLAYPGDYGIWWGNLVQSRRLQWSGHRMPSWTMYAPYPTIVFSKRIEKLEKDEDVVLDTDGTYVIKCSNAKGSKETRDFLGRFTVPAGTNILLEVSVFNSERPPALRVSGKNVFSDASWRAAWCRGDDTCAEEIGSLASDDTLPPGKQKLNVKHVEPVKTWKDSKGRLFADFGRETYGFLKLRGVKGEGVLKIVYAESLLEAEEEELDTGAYATQLDSWGYQRVSSASLKRIDEAHGFRYVCVKPVEGDVSVDSLAMDYEWKDVPLRGSFESSDPLLNRIWDVSAYTLSLTRREVMIEGIKRDHWVWSGDAVQNFLMDYYTCCDYDGVKHTLWTLRGKDPVVMHLNRIMDYTWYWFEGVRNYALYSGDERFFRQIYPRMKSLMEWGIKRLDADGRPVDRPGDWMFIDWAPKPLENYGGVTSFEQMLLVRALEATAFIAGRIGDEEDRRGYSARAEKLKSEIKKIWWVEKKGALAHILRKDGTLSEEITRYPNMFGLMYGYFTAQEARRVVDNVILNDKVMKIQTPYMRFYELEGLCALGMQEKVLKEIRDYWGGMLKLGATSFWELYNPAESGRMHYAMYGRNFGRSLCHAWGASPVYLLGRYFLGVAPTSPGFATYDVKPATGGLKWMKGKVPTPHGDILVEVNGAKATVTGVEGLVGTLHWGGKTCRIDGGATVSAEARAR